MRKSFLVSIIYLITLLTSQYSLANEESTFKFTADLTWASKYMISGFNVGGDNPVVQFAAKTDHTPTGLSFMFWTAVQTDRMNKQYDEQDFFILYSRDFFTDSSYTINVHGFYDYWMFPNSEPATDDFDVVTSADREQGNKFQAGFSLPKAFPVFESYLVPTYNIYQIRYWEHNRADMDRSGTHHEFLLEYFQPTPIFIPGATYQYAGATASTNYYNGAFDIEPGWSHTTATLAAGVYALKSIFSMGLNYQWTHEKTLNPTDEFWTTLSYIKKF